MSSSASPDDLFGRNRSLALNGTRSLPVAGNDPNCAKLATIESRLAPFNPTAQPAVHAALELAGIGQDDVVFDLGCGDGRFVTTAAVKTGCRCVGIEYNSVYAERARAAAEAAGVSDLVEIRHGDACCADLSDATVVFVYLVPEGLKAVLPKLKEALAAGCRIVSYMFSLPGIEPTRQTVYKRVAKISVYEHREDQGQQA
jgi:precorrin-6B methylase 2